MTIADLARDGMLTVTMIGKSASARLTPRGTWFARSLAAEFDAIKSHGRDRRSAANRTNILRRVQY
jgi:hypothetical protein